MWYLNTKCESSLILYTILILNQSHITSALSHAREASPHFTRHSVIRPQILHARTKREITTTRENNLTHIELLTVILTIHGVDHVLDLRLNTDLIPETYQRRHQEDGVFKTHKPTKNEIEVCQYQGTVRAMPDAWAALSTCRGLSGVVFDGKTLYYLDSIDETLDGPHYLYRDDHLAVNISCGNEDPKHLHVFDNEVNGIRYKRDATKIIAGPYKASKKSLYVELVLVADNDLYRSMGSSLTRVHQRCKEIANIVNARYNQLNIFVALVGVEVWSHSDMISFWRNSDSILSDFTKYRTNSLEIPNDTAHLLTKKKFESNVVGKAYVGTMCQGSSTGVNNDIWDSAALTSNVVAHEMGHNFGMDHDESGCQCIEESCLMGSHTAGTHWSSCSVNYLSKWLRETNHDCLKEMPKKLFDGSTCGNGFVEDGEECDCGMEKECDNRCCNPKTCMMLENAECAAGECCDLKTCKLRSAGTECRSEEEECDLPEYCTGQSEFCPRDVFKMDGTVCRNGEAYCYQKSCRTHDDQCRSLRGPDSRAAKKWCWNMNEKGDKVGNCGTKATKEYAKCTRSNVMCGLLQCNSGEVTSVKYEVSHIVSFGGDKCLTFLSTNERATNTHAGMVQNGAKCGENKMCVNQACIPVTTIRDSLPRTEEVCPNNCSGNGVCNNLGHCHCNQGYGPPRCDVSGSGGSVDSGYQISSGVGSAVILSMYIIFLGVLPTVVLIAFCIWTIKKGKRDGKSPNYLARPIWNKLRNTKGARRNTKHCVSSEAYSKTSCSSIGNTLRVSVSQLFSRKFRSDPERKVFTISDKLSTKTTLEIRTDGLVTTTNRQLIDCGRDIESRKLMLVNSSSLNSRDRNDDEMLRPESSSSKLPQHKRQQPSVLLVPHKRELNVKGMRPALIPVRVAPTPPKLKIGSIVAERQQLLEKQSFVETDEKEVDVELGMQKTREEHPLGVAGISKMNEQQQQQQFKRGPNFAILTPPKMASGKYQSHVVVARGTKKMGSQVAEKLKQLSDNQNPATCTPGKKELGSTIAERIKNLQSDSHTVDV